MLRRLQLKREPDLTLAALENAQTATVAAVVLVLVGGRGYFLDRAAA
jgi:hypothetical protein